MEERTGRQAHLASSVRWEAVWAYALMPVAMLLAMGVGEGLKEAWEDWKRGVESGTPIKAL